MGGECTPFRLDLLPLVDCGSLSAFKNPHHINQNFGRGRVTIGRGRIIIGRGRVTIGRGRIMIGRGRVTIGRGTVTFGRGRVTLGRGSHPWQRSLLLLPLSILCFEWLSAIS